MRVLSNVEVVEVSGAGLMEDAWEAIKDFFGFSGSTPTALVCANNTATQGSTTTTTQTCSNGISTTVVMGAGFVQTTTITPGTHADGSIGYKYIGGTISYSAAPTTVVSTIINGTPTTVR